MILTFSFLLRYLPKAFWFTIGVNQRSERIHNQDGERHTFGIGAEIVFTRDTHDENYAQTQEGRKLPVPHCVKNTKGWQIAEALSDYVQNVFDKYTFGSLLLAQYALDNQFDCIDLVGVCTDICVISNALLLKAFLPEAEINVVESCCAGVTPERHRNAIEAMRACQINII